LQLLQWELHGAALAALQQLSSTNSSSSQPGSAAADSSSSSAVSEKGVLQLLFDQRLLRDVLGGSRPPAADAAAATGAAANGTAGAGSAAARKRLVQDVEQQLQVGGGDLTSKFHMLKPACAGLDCALALQLLQCACTLASFHPLDNHAVSCSTSAYLPLCSH
jgi:hypothetical protein